MTQSVNQQQYIKAIAGDKAHQLVAISFYRNGIQSSDVIDTLKQSNYIVNIAGQFTKVSASSVASIVTGLEIAHPSAKTKLKPINNGVGTPSVPVIEVEE